MNGFDDAPAANLGHAITGYLPGDRPLLEELGIDFAAIKNESLRVFFCKGSSELQGRDLFGPFLFFALFALVLVARGRVHFGYLYFLSIISSVFIYGLATLMSQAPIDLFGVVNILGYAFIPTLIFSWISAILPIAKGVKVAFGVGFGLWSMFVSTQGITQRYQVQQKFLLLAYPILLVYLCFVIIAVV